MFGWVQYISGAGVRCWTLIGQRGHMRRGLGCGWSAVWWNHVGSIPALRRHTQRASLSAVLLLFVLGPGTLAAYFYSLANNWVWFWKCFCTHVQLKDSHFFQSSSYIGWMDDGNFWHDDCKTNLHNLTEKYFWFWWEKRGPSEAALPGHETTRLWWCWLAGINAARLINMQTAEGGGRALDWYINNTFLCYQTFGFAQLLAANRIYSDFTPPGHSYQ